MTIEFMKKVKGSYLGINGDAINITSAVDYQLVNPASSYVQANFTAPGKALILPKMDDADSLRLGQSVRVENTGEEFFDIKTFGLSALYIGLAPGATIEFFLVSASTDGNWQWDGALNGERIITLSISSPYTLQPSDDGKLIIFTSGTQLNLLSRTSYPTNFYFSYKVLGSLIGQIVLFGADTIDGEGVYTPNQWSAGEIFNSGSAWLLKDQKVGYFDSGVYTFQDIAVDSINVLGMPFTYLTPYVVGPTHANFTTIQDAINAAVTDGASITSPKVIGIQPGSYTENITMYDGIFLTALTRVNPLLGLFAPDGSPFDDTQVCSVEIVGNVDMDFSAITADTSCGLYGIFVNPTTGNAFDTKGFSSGVHNNLLTLDGCKAQITGTAGLIFNQRQGSFEFSAIRSVFVDNTSGESAQLLQVPNDATSTTFLYLDHCSTYVGQGATANTFNTNGGVVIRCDGGTMGTSFDATNCNNYFFRAFEGFIHYNQEIGNVVPYHVVGSAPLGRVLYSPGCSIQGALGVNIATIDPANPSFEYQDTGVGYGVIGFGASSSTVSGGFQTRDCMIRTATATYQKQLDLIRVGFGGASEFTAQAGVQTTNATITNLSTITLNQLESITLKGTISAAQSDHTNAVGGDFLITARRASGGNVTLVGSAMTNVNSSSAATFTVDVDTGTQTVRIRVTGVAATTYNWVTTYRYQKVLTNAV